jgi:uncharacterized membrane protein
MAAMTHSELSCGVDPVPDATRLIRLTATPEDHRIAQLAAAAVGLSLVDAAIPLPLPGIKPGLANIVTLIVLARYGWAAAAWVSGLRVFAGVLARCWLIPHDGLFFMVPFFAVAALAFGIINGLIAARLLEELPLRESESENA